MLETHKFSFEIEISALLKRAIETTTSILAGISRSVVVVDINESKSMAREFSAITGSNRISTGTHSLAL